MRNYDRIVKRLEELLKRIEFSARAGLVESLAHDLAHAARYLRKLAWNVILRPEVPARSKREVVSRLSFCERLWEHAVSVADRWSETALSMIAALALIGFEEAARRALEKLKSRWRDSALRVRLCNVALELGFYDIALELLEELSQERTSMEVLYDLALVQYMLGRERDALKTLARMPDYWAEMLKIALNIACAGRLDRGGKSEGTA